MKIIVKKILNLIKKIDLFFYNKLYSKNTFFLLTLLSKIGNFFSIAIFIIFMFILPFYITKKIAVISFFSIFYSTVIVFIFKYSFKRKRIHNENNFKSKIDPYSFPSGHISRLSSLILPSIFLFSLAILFFVLSFFVSFLRIKKGYHYFTDCLIGFFIGLLSGWMAIYTFPFLILYLNEFLK